MEIIMSRVNYILGFEANRISQIQEQAVRKQPQLLHSEKQLYRTTWTLTRDQQRQLSKCYIRYSKPARFAAIINNDTIAYKPANSRQKYIMCQMDIFPVFWTFDTSKYIPSLEDMVLISFRASYEHNFYAALVRIVQVAEKELSAKFQELQ